MPPSDLAVQEQHASGSRQKVVNDFSIQVATVNGSGSQTANLVLLRSILLMGVPVSGKNMFPSIRIFPAVAFIASMTYGSCLVKWVSA